MYFWFRRTHGKVITPAKTLYARYPSIALFVKKLYATEAKMNQISPREKRMIQLQVATINSCEFCQDITAKRMYDDGMNVNEIQQEERASNASLRAIAIRDFVDEITFAIGVSEERYNALKIHCTDEEIIEIVFVASAENFLNRLVKPFNINSDELS